MRYPARAAALALLVVSAAASREQRTTVRVPMRDGIHLSTHVFRPVGPARQLPVLLIRTPYGKGTDLLPGYRIFIENGYGVVVQDVRGRYASEGFFRPPVQEENDGDDTIRWIARQPWSNGRVGMLGGSYVGIVQWKAALSRNPNLKAIFPVVSGYDDYFDRFYSRGGGLKLGHRLSWIAENVRAPSHPLVPFERYVAHLPLRTADTVTAGQRIGFWQEAIDHPGYDAYWRARSTRARIDRITTPVFSVAGWYDNFAQSDLEAFTELSRKSSVHRIVVGPWAHSMSVPFPGISFGPNAGAPIRRFQLGWFDHWLKSARPAGETADAPVRIFVMGENRWRDEQEWPLQRTRYTPLYLSSRSGAATLNGDGILASSPQKAGTNEFAYDPRRPVPTRGGPVCCNPKIFPWGPMDQRDVEARADVLVYSTSALKEDIEVTGVVRAVLYVSTSAPDTDFTAKLVDVFPDGHARNLTDGILRLRYRKSMERAELAKPGEVYRIVIDAGVTSNTFLAGHRIRVEISSSNFPRFDRNPNTGRAIADETDLRVARQTVFHGQKYPSHLLLPVIPEAAMSRTRSARR
jgi:uncharacterized protein